MPKLQKHLLIFSAALVSTALTYFLLYHFIAKIIPNPPLSIVIVSGILIFWAMELIYNMYETNKKVRVNNKEELIENNVTEGASEKTIFIAIGIFLLIIFVYVAYFYFFK